MGHNRMELMTAMISGDFRKKIEFEFEKNKTTVSHIGFSEINSPRVIFNSFRLCFCYEIPTIIIVDLFLCDLP